MWQTPRKARRNRRRRQNGQSSPPDRVNSGGFPRPEGNADLDWSTVRRENSSEGMNLMSGRAQSFAEARGADSSGWRSLSRNTHSCISLSNAEAPRTQPAVVEAPTPSRSCVNMAPATSFDHVLRKTPASSSWSDSNSGAGKRVVWNLMARAAVGLLIGKKGVKSGEVLRRFAVKVAASADSQYVKLIHEDGDVGQLICALIFLERAQNTTFPKNVTVSRLCVPGAIPNCVLKAKRVPAALLSQFPKCETLFSLQSPSQTPSDVNLEQRVSDIQQSTLTALRELFEKRAHERFLGNIPPLSMDDVRGPQVILRIDSRLSMILYRSYGEAGDALISGDGITPTELSQLRKWSGTMNSFDSMIHLVLPQTPLELLRASRKYLISPPMQHVALKIHLVSSYVSGRKTFHQARMFQLLIFRSSREARWNAIGDGQLEIPSEDDIPTLAPSKLVVAVSPEHHRGTRVLGLSPVHNGIGCSTELSYRLWDHSYGFVSDQGEEHDGLSLPQKVRDFIHHLRVDFDRQTIFLPDSDGVRCNSPFLVTERVCQKRERTVDRRDDLYLIFRNMEQFGDDDFFIRGTGFSFCWAQHALPETGEPFQSRETVTVRSRRLDHEAGESVYRYVKNMISLEELVDVISKHLKQTYRLLFDVVDTLEKGLHGSELPDSEEEVLKCDDRPSESEDTLTESDRFFRRFVKSVLGLDCNPGVVFASRQPC